MSHIQGPEPYVVERHQQQGRNGEWGQDRPALSSVPSSRWVQSFLCPLLSAFESHRTTCRKNSREFGKKGGEDRQKMHFFFQEAGKCKEN
ncbi:uncharacterized protein LOC100592149 isoform X2 [Nomascus leucogenys]|uniref:uncharacterized protein LOC100592149 isoform X2 n=1 Tax=Nomascus leucogenys TaxID=61853 RepID=UPI00122D989A|nr:uncharacterized protein LOC100592149 isoform X2 [Nomascus leucogenys]